MVIKTSLFHYLILLLLLGLYKKKLIQEKEQSKEVLLQARALIPIRKQQPQLQLLIKH